MIYKNIAQKLIGTFVPVSALSSLAHPEHDHGTFAESVIFLDWLKKTNQSAWQLLPLHQTQLESGSSFKHVPSPYKSYGIGLDPTYLPQAFADITPLESEKNDFIATNGEWIHDYALFCALRDYFQTDDWRNWDSNLRRPDANVIKLWTDKLAKEIDIHIITQWQLHEAYGELRNKANQLGISLIGDLSFYLPLNSPIVWKYQDAFQIEKDGTIKHVAGIPDGPSSTFGRQVWGHPLYNWGGEASIESAIKIWQMRLRYAAKHFDLIRWDCAKAMYHYGVMDVENNQRDEYRNGPGEKVFKELIKFSKQCGLSVFAEDSGNKVEEMRESMRLINIPGIKIFRFGLDEKKDKVIDEYAHIARYPEMTVAYTTTHDTETLLGYLYKLTPEQKQRLAVAANVAYDSDDRVFAKRVRDAILISPAHMVIIPMQDWLLTTERINIPGTELAVDDPNWHFRIPLPIETLPIDFY